MSNIDEVINRSRQGGTFTERKSFTVARGRAIQKMRQFALVDPHYYILELIQSAVGNGATYIDIQADKTSSALSYIGGSFREVELAQLFDFLFASKDDVEHGPLRQLALGINALMNFEPAEIVIETGDGSLKGTTRVEIRGKDDVVEVGTPDKPLKGTFIRATGMKRNKARSSSLKVLNGHPREYHAVENRCITAPVPILFNHDPLFGYSSQKTPKSLYGFGKTLTFDEGDFYGTIGIARRHSGATFRLITHGVWIQSVRRSFGAAGDRIGGVITYDRLRKTADHGSIVEDERYEEMWLRLRPYINQLTSNRGGDDIYQVYTLAGEKLDSQDVLSLVRGFERIVIAPRNASENQELGEKARALGESLDAPVVCVDSEKVEDLRILAGANVELIIPDFENQREVSFYTGAEDPLPPAPWLIAPAELDDLDLLQLGERLPWPEDAAPPSAETAQAEGGGEEFSLRALRQCVWLLDRRVRKGQSPQSWKTVNLDPLGKSIRARVYTPEGEARDGLTENVEVRAARRVVWRGYQEGVAPGQILVIEAANISPKSLWEPPRGGGDLLAKVVAELVIDENRNKLEEAANAGLRAALRSEIAPATSASRLVLAALTSRLVRRIQARSGSRRVVFSVVDQGLDLDVLEKPLLKTLTGEEVSLRRLEDIMEECHGLVYGVRSDVKADLEGLDRSKILDLEPLDEGLVIALVGPTAYVRVDRRDLLATVNNLRCRDIAAGLRTYQDFPFLVEGGALEEWSDPAKQAGAADLMAQLVELISNRAASWDEQENRRQAWRHLQYFVLMRERFPWAAELDGADHLPLFRLAGGETISGAQLRKAIQERGYVEMLDGWALGAAEMGVEGVFAAQLSSSAPLNSLVLAMNPFLLHLLGEKVQGAAEYHLSPKEAEGFADDEVPMMLESVVLDEEEIQGIIGVPREAVKAPAVVLFAEGGDVILHRDLGALFGVIGKVRLRSRDRDKLEEKLRNAARDVLSHLLARLPAILASGDEEELHRALKVLLGYAGTKVNFHGMPDGTISMEMIWDGLAREILHAPIFVAEEGLPITPMGLIRQFKREAWLALSRNEALDFQPRGLASKQPKALDWFVENFLTMERIQRPMTAQEAEKRGSKTGAPELGPEVKRDAALASLEEWLNRLRPDLDGHDSESRAAKRFHLEIGDPEGVFQGEIREEFCVLRTQWGAGASQSVLFVNRNHWLYQWLAREGSASPQPLAWAVLAAYAHINNVEEPITNDHELIFQRRVAAALEKGFRKEPAGSAKVLV